MTLLNVLIENLPNLSNISTIMKGGKIDQGIPRHKNPFMILIIIIFMILLKGLIVYILYNNLVPKLIYSLKSDNRTIEDILNNFKTFSYTESILLVIFFNTLFTF